MAYYYTIPKNLPTSAIRLYRFPYKGERSSARLNLLLQAIIGDIRASYKALEDTEGYATDSLGCQFMTTKELGFEE